MLVKALFTVSVLSLSGVSLQRLLLMVVKLILLEKLLMLHVLLVQNQ